MMLLLLVMLLLLFVMMVMIGIAILMPIMVCIVIVIVFVLNYVVYSFSGYYVTDWHGIPVTHACFFYYLECILTSLCVCNFHFPKMFFCQPKSKFAGAKAPPLALWHSLSTPLTLSRRFVLRLFSLAFLSGFDALLSYSSRVRVFF